MTIESFSPRAAAFCAVALCVAAADAATVELLLRYDLLGVFGGQAGLRCISLGMPARLCDALWVSLQPWPFILAGIIVAVIMALGLYDPRPLISRLEQSRQPHWWLAVNAAGAAIFVSPYLLAAAGMPLSEAAPCAPYAMLLGALTMALGLLFWLSGVQTRAGTLYPVLGYLAIALGIEAVTGLQEFGWDSAALVAATFDTVSFLLKIMGENAVSQPGQAIIGIRDFRVIVKAGCSGFDGIAMVSAVMGSYVLLLRRRLWIARALLLIPLAAALSWLLNGVRISTLILIGTYVSPDLAVDGFHAHAGWLAFCVLSGSMLLAAENIAWIHRNGVAKAPPAMSVINDPVVAQIAPFLVLLVTSLLAGAAFTQPEMAYPLRAVLMAAALLVFHRASRSELAPVDAVPILAGVLVALVWLGVKAGGSPLTVADILGPVSRNAAILWIFFRVAGTVLLVPLIEEMFFRGYMLRQLDFGGTAGKATALALSSALFGALHANPILAGASGVLFGLLALRRGRLVDAVAAHATANAGIAAWAVCTGDWSVI
ncbi:MAG: exosortase E/protease, VPEID-CTERM system [Rhodomicrobium sp.]